MSQISTYESVTYTGSVSSTRESTPIGPIIAGAVAGACAVAGKVLFPKFQESDRISMGEIYVMKGIAPPHEISDAFARLLRDQQGFAQQATLQERKDAFLSELRTRKVACPRPEPVKEALNAYLHADAASEQQRRADLLKVVREGAERGYIDAVSDHVRRALYIAGLDTIADEKCQGLAQIAGTDTEGRMLRVKVLRRTGDRIALECETHGYEGRACQGVMDRFHAALTGSGLSYERRDHKWTGPGCILPSTKQKPGTQKPFINDRKRDRQ